MHRKIVKALNWTLQVNLRGFFYYNCFSKKKKISFLIQNISLFQTNIYFTKSNVYIKDGSLHLEIVSQFSRKLLDCDKLQDR